MPSYRIVSGDMNVAIATRHRADASALALVAVHQAVPQRPGTLIEISGGQFPEDEACYLLFDSVARKLGLLERME